MAEPDRILRIRTVLQRTGLSRSTLYRKINDGSFPRQVRISINGAGWRESAIRRWMADPVAYRAADQADGAERARTRDAGASPSRPTG
jgi:prophage regulatory protein